MADRRLWVKVATDIGRNSKFVGLSDAAFRAWVEALAHAKELNKDGFIPIRDARRWMPELDELLTNDPERPSLVKVAGGYQIHDYTKHQESAEKVARRREASQHNGLKGGRPPKPRNLEPNPGHNPGAKAESRVQSPEISTYVSESQSLDNRAREMTDSVSPGVQALASLAGIKNVAEIRELIVRETGIPLTLDRSVTVARWLIDKSKNPVKNARSYITTCLANDREETRQYIYEQGLER